MSLFDALRHRLRPLFRRHEFDRELDEEFRHHLELDAQEFPGGQSAFGSRAYYMEETRRMTPLGWLDALAQDLRYAWRNLRRTPAFTTVAVLSLAIGIGANSAIFSLIYSILLQPLPLPHPEQLVLAQHTGREFPNDIFSYAEYQSLRRSPGFAGVTAEGGTGDVPVVAGGVQRAVGVDAVDGNFFGTLGLRPERGRLITPADEATRAPVVVISDALWTELFNRAPGAIGSTITMHGASFTVVGVTPDAFRGLSYPGRFEVAIPLSTLALVGGDPVEGTGANAPNLQIVGRLAQGAALPGVAKMLDGTYRSCCGTGPQASGVRLASIERGITSGKFDVRAMFGTLLFELLGAAGVVLLAACANLGTLLLARARARERELAVRLSLGASRRRLAAQMLVESALLAGLGTAAGLVLANWALRLIAHRLPAPILDRVGLHLTGDVLGFTVAVAVFAVLLFGGIPAWRATRTDLIAPLNEGGHRAAGGRAGWLDRGVVVAQVALALVLVNGAGLFVATLRNLRHVRGGFATDHLVVAGLDARGTPYESEGFVSLAQPLLAHAARLPGVQSAALALSVPMFGGRRFGSDVEVEGYTPAPDERMQVWCNPVTPGFFATLGIALRLGRDFAPTDRPAGQQVAIVNEAFARQYLRGRNPLGATIRSVRGPGGPRGARGAGGPAEAGGADTLLMQIVGVAGDARYDDPREPPPPMMYVPLAQFQRIPEFGRIPVLTLAVKTAGDDRTMPGALRSAVLAEAPSAQVYGPETMEASLDETLNRETLTAELATLFGAVALLLAGVGLYGVVSYGVTQRTREIGVRMALGAAGPAVVWMVLRQALLLVVIGVLVGAPLAFGGGRAVAALLYGLAGQGGLFVLGAGMLLLVVAVAASALPARRAARVDPLVALRAE